MVVSSTWNSISFRAATKYFISYSHDDRTILEPVLAVGCKLALVLDGLVAVLALVGLVNAAHVGEWHE